MTEEQPRKVAIHTLQNLSTEISWTEILYALRKSWATGQVPKELFHQAIDVFGSERRAVLWLTSPHIALGGKIPTEIVNEAIGQQLIFDELGRIEYGVY